MCLSEWVDLPVLVPFRGEKASRLEEPYKANGRGDPVGLFLPSSNANN